MRDLFWRVVFRVGYRITDLGFVLTDWYDKHNYCPVEPSPSERFMLNRLDAAGYPQSPVPPPLYDFDEPPKPGTTHGPISEFIRRDR